MLQKLKYFFSILKNTYSYNNSINDYFLDYYLRHHKIVGWWNGLPFYSSFTNPGLSKPQAHFISRILLGQLTDKNLPGMVHIGITDKCNATCEHCSFYNAIDDPKKNILDTDKMKQIIRDCQNFGISVINFVGGEPLLRQDICELIDFVDKDRSVSSIYTNGWFLKEKAAGLKKAQVMAVNVSLDSTDSSVHDKVRKLPGLFDRAIGGIKECQKEGIITGISTTVTQEDLLNGNFEKMLHFAKEMRVNELIVLDTMPVGMYSHRVDLSENKIDRAKLFSLVDRFNFENSRPGVFCYAHLRDKTVFGCSAGRNYFYISPYGEMHPCDFTAKPVGNILTETLPLLWFKLNEQRKLMGDKYFADCCSQEPLKTSVENGQPNTELRILRVLK